MTPRERFGWTVAMAVLAGMAVIGGYGMATTQHHRPLPGCSARLHEPALTFHGATVTGPAKGWRPCVDYAGKSRWWDQ